MSKLKNILEIKDATFTYPDGHRAIHGISFGICHGEAVGIIGANGAGKSTLLLLMMGVHFPGQGEVMVGDVEIMKKTLPDIRKQLGMVFQNPDDQLFMTSVYDDVAFGPRNYRLDEAEVDRRVRQALTKVGISHLADRAPHRLSGGEKRCAAIASVLSMEPEVLIMDEPSAALDPKARRKVIELLNSFDHTKIVTSHDLDLILDTCDRVIVLKDGGIVADGSAMEILKDAALLDACGLELPLSMQNCALCGK